MNSVILCLMFCLILVKPGFCSCEAPATPVTLETVYSDATVVFTGEVVRMENMDNDDKQSPYKRRQRVTFKVMEQYKGEHVDEISITQPGCIDCWVEDVAEFRMGEKYLVSPEGSADDLKLGSCNWMAALSLAKTYSRESGFEEFFKKHGFTSPFIVALSAKPEVSADQAQVKVAPPADPCEGKSIGKSCDGHGAYVGTYNGHKYMMRAANTVLDWNAFVTFCRNLTVGGYSDWRVPSKEELDGVLYPNQFVLGMMNGTFWSSESDMDNAGCQHFFTGAQAWCSKASPNYGRCVRSY